MIPNHKGQGDNRKTKGWPKKLENPVPSKPSQRDLTVAQNVEVISVGVARAMLHESLLMKAVKFGKFKLASGKESDFYIDCKLAVLGAYAHQAVGVLLLHEIEAVQKINDIQYVAGVELGGCPLASAVALISGLTHPYSSQILQALYVRKEAKTHGSKNMIEGALPAVIFPPANKKVVLLEDVVTTGGSSISAIRTLQAGGFIIQHVVALVDRQEGGMETIREIGVPASSIFTRKDFQP